MTYLITAAIGLVAVAILAGMVWLIARDGDDPDHPGADEDYATEVHDMAAAPRLADAPTAEIARPYTSHHHEDTVEIVAGEYRPLYGRWFVAATGGRYADRASDRWVPTGALSGARIGGTR